MKNLEFLAKYQIVEKGDFFIKKRTFFGWNYIRTIGIDDSIYVFRIFLSVMFFLISLISLISFLMLISGVYLSSFSNISGIVFLISCFLGIYMWFWKKLKFETYKDAKKYIMEQVSIKESIDEAKLYKKKKKDRIKNSKMVIHQL